MIDSRRRNLRRLALGLVVICGLLVVGFVLHQVVDYVHYRRIEKRVEYYLPLIVQYADENGLPVELVRAVVRAESGGNPRALSSKDARGLMQITSPAEQDVLRLRRWDKGDLFEPEYNVKVGTAYLSLMTHRFDDDHALAVAAYHMGASRVQKLRNEHPELSSRQLIESHANPTTRRYCRTVLGW